MSLVPRLSISLLAAVTAAGADSNDVITLPLAEVVPIIDGRFSEAEYAHAVKLSGAFLNHCPWMNNLPKAALPGQPEVYLARDRERLFLAFVNPLAEGERPTCGVRSRDRATLSTDDAVEVFLQPPVKAGQLMRFYHIMGNARGALYDAENIPGIGQEIVGWDGQIAYKAGIETNRWIAELALPLASLGLADSPFFLVEFGRNGGSIPKSYSGAFKDAARHTRVRLDDDAPLVKVESFGDFERGLFNPRLSVRAARPAGPFSAEFALDPSSSPTGNPFRAVRELSPETGKTASASAEHPLTRGEAGTATVALYTGDSRQPLFRRVFPYAAFLEQPPPPRRTPVPVSAGASYSPSTGLLSLSVDVLYLGLPEKDLSAVFSVPGYTGDPARLTVTSFTMGAGYALLDLGPRPEGRYTVQADLFNGPDKVTNIACAFSRTIRPWENNGIGLSPAVPVPWTPLRAEGSSLFCWGREYRLGPDGLPAQILASNPEFTRSAETRPLLGGPFRFRAAVEGRPVSWTNRAFRIDRREDAEIRFSSMLEGGGLRIALTGTLEYDGLIRLELSAASAGGPARLESLSLEMPLENDLARLLHSVGENMRANNTAIALPEKGDGILWDSRTHARNASVIGNFLPYLWVGDEDRGLAWTADHDRNLSLDPDRAFLEVERTGPRTVLRVHLVQAPLRLARPLEYAFAIQATPLKPRPPRRLWEPYVANIGMMHFDEPMMTEAIFDTHGLVAADYRYRRWISTNAAATNRFGFVAGMGRYLCFQSDRIPEGDYYQTLTSDFRGEWSGYNRSRQDFYLWCIKKWTDQIGLRSLYYDNTFPMASGNLLAGMGWIDDRGRLRFGYDLSGMRQYARRVYSLLKGNTPNQSVLEHHMTDAACVTYLGFSDIWLDGEGPGYPEESLQDPDFVDRWGSETALARIRTTALGRQYGVLPQFLCLPAADRKNRHEEMHAILDLHEIFGFGLKPLDRKEGVRGFPLFADDVRFHPYWGTRPLVRVESPVRMLASGWTRPGEARVIVSNLGSRDAPAELIFDRERLGLAGTLRAVDEGTGEEWTCPRDRLTLDKVERHKLRRIWLYGE